MAVLPGVLRWGAPVIRPNVIIYDEESSPFTIIESNSSNIIVSSTEGIEEGSIVNSGVIDAAPQGLLRKVTAIRAIEDGYLLETDPAALTEAIECCDIHATVSMGEDGTYIVSEQIGQGAENSLVQQAFAEGGALDNLFVYPERGTDAEKVSPVTATAGMKLEVSLKIDRGKVDMSVIGRVGAELAMKELSASFERNLFDRDLLPFTIPVGPLMIPIDTNLAFDMALDVSSQALDMDVAASLGCEVGFEYTTDDGFKAICENTSKKPSVRFNPGDDLFSVSAEGGFTGTLGLRIFGIAGPDLSIGLATDAGARLQTVPEGEKTKGAIELPGCDAKLRGMIEGKVYVPLSGTFRCSTPKFNPFDTLGSIVDFEGIELFDTGDSLVLLSIDETFGEIEEAFPNAYTTKLYTELDEPGPALTFGYPDSWRIVDREVDEELGREYVRLKNDRDAVVSLEWWLAKPVPMPSMRATMMGRSGDAEVLQDVSFTGRAYPGVDDDLFAKLGRNVLQGGAERLLPWPESMDESAKSVELSLVRQDYRNAMSSVPGMAEDGYALWRVVPAVSSPQEAAALLDNEYLSDPDAGYPAPFFYGWIDFHGTSGFEGESSSEDAAEIVAILASLRQIPASD